ncbi:putative aliphatic sulfonates-binding protein precursor [Novacetimonas maltaceti]|uniref:Putative aliphatic sulfonates-binding protein n=2 Tax=Novacetimonas maltaceti TaxID=1203393 RepID=A0A2S3W0I4_9PROT|nr:putative aliphatic sulfonates-binding protein precursor [Novacetimonas maltaceti]
MMLNRRSLMTLMLSGATAMLAAGQASAAPQRIRIGYQKYGTLILLKEKGFLEAALANTGITVEWSQFPAGPPLLQAMAAGAIDVGQTGDLPPVFAQANIPDSIVYFGHEPKSGSSEAIIVHDDSPIRSIEDLRGRRVAVTRGSDANWLLLSSLLQKGLSFHDIHLSYLLPAAARPAFEAGTIDAWAIWDPYLSAVGQKTRALATGADIKGAMSFYLSSLSFYQNIPDLLVAVRNAIIECDNWAQAHREDVTRILASSTGLAPDIVRNSVDKLPFRFNAMDDDSIAQQEEIAAAFHKENLIGSLPDIRKSIATLKG